MASSPEMEPPGFEHVLAHSPPTSEMEPPTAIGALNPTSPDEAPPGFDKPNAWIAMSGNDIWDPPPSTLSKPPELPPPPEVEINPTANGSCNGLQETASVGEDMVTPPMPGESLHVSDSFDPHLAQMRVLVPIKRDNIDPFQGGTAVPDTVRLEPLQEPPKVETPMECLMLGPPEAHLTTPLNTEILNSTVLPSSPLPAASEQTLTGDGLGGAHTVSEVFGKPDTRIKEETNRPVLKPESVPRKETPSDSQTVQLPSVPVCPSAGSESVSVSESFSLPPSPPPIPLVSESIAPEPTREILYPEMPLPLSPPPPPPPALVVHDIGKSPVLKSECDNLNQNTYDRGLIGNNISSEHEAMAPAQPPLNLHEANIPDPVMLPPAPPPLSAPQQLKCESLVPLVSEMTEVRRDNQQPLKENYQYPLNQEMKMYPCSLRDGTPDMLSFETGLPVNQITDEPPLKKSRNMYETQDQLRPEECQPEDEDSFESVTPERIPHQDDDMEQIDMDMSDDDTFDRSPTDMEPPGSDTRDFASLEEAPPGYNTIGQTSQMEMKSQDALSGMGQMICGSCHELISYPHGALHVLCTCCQTINLVLEACQVGNITCGQCSVLLMYPFGTPSVRCSCCRYVTEIGVHNMRPPLSVQQGGSHPTLECQLTEIS